jgi:hypothetical protein
MDITIYLPDELGKWAKENDLGLSRMLREAVEEEKRRREAETALEAGRATHKLDVREPNSHGGDDDITVRLHGTLIATQDVDDGHGSTEVYLGEDGKLYIHDFLGELHRDAEPDDLREYLDEAAYIKAMRALGQKPVIDVGLPYLADRGRIARLRRGVYSRPDRIVITLTAGGLRSGYFSLRNHLDFFPADAVGASSRGGGEGAMLTVHFDGLPYPVETDITGTKKFFRSREPIGDFFAHHDLQPGENIAIEKQSDYEYRVLPVR